MCKPLQFISPVNTDHAMFIWKRKPVLSFSKKLSRYKHSEIPLSLNVIALSNSYMYIRSLQVWHGLESFFCKTAFTSNCWLLCLSGCVMYNICNTWKKKTKNPNVVYVLICISNAPN